MGLIDGEAEIVAREVDGRVDMKVTSPGEWMRVSLELMEQMVERENERRVLLAREQAVRDRCAEALPDHLEEPDAAMRAAICTKINERAAILALLDGTEGGT